jgi:uncharacterized damage-inducible protein DinB
MAKKVSTNPWLAHAQHVMRRVYLPRIERCLKQLSPGQIWWRPNDACNSVGNLVLHLSGNVRQWIISGLGGRRDTRQRDLEFSERGPLPREKLARRLRSAVTGACRMMGGLSPEDLGHVHTIQKFQVTGFEAVFHVAEHFSHHAGQIILMTKMLTGTDLNFTRLPGVDGRRMRRRRILPAL